MSRTDKTTPFRVRTAYEGAEYHQHRQHDCDLPSRAEQAEHYSWLRSYNHCSYELSTGYYNMMTSYFPRTGAVRMYRDKDLGRQRGAERRAQRAALKAARSGEDLYDIEFGDGRHRHNALWEAW